MIAPSDCFHGAVLSPFVVSVFSAIRCCQVGTFEPEGTMSALKMYVGGDSPFKRPR